MTNTARIRAVSSVAMVIASVGAVLAIAVLVVLLRCIGFSNIASMFFTADYGEAILIGAKEDEETRPLVTAIIDNQDASALEQLIDARPDAVNGHVHGIGTPLHACVGLSRKDLVSLLLAKGATPMRRVDLMLIGGVYDPDLHQICDIKSISALERAIEQQEIEIFWMLMRWAQENNRIQPIDMKRLICLAQHSDQPELHNQLIEIAASIENSTK